MVRNIDFSWILKMIILKTLQFQNIFFKSAMKADQQVLSFRGSQQWRVWLDKNHGKSNGIWMKLFKKSSHVQSVSYQSAVDNALCYGWIDGQRKKHDQESFLQKFTPRREKSIWSKRNIENIARLQSQKLMMPPGRAQVQRAKDDGRWQASYDNQKDMVIPQDFLEAVKANKQRFQFFSSLNRGDLFAICLQLQTAKKPETRAKRFAKLLSDLDQQQRPGNKKERKKTDE